MFTYLIALCVIGWIIPKVIVQKYPEWLVVFPVILLTWIATLAVGLGIMALEISAVGAENAVRRMAGAWGLSLIFAVWSAIKFKITAARGKV